MTPQAAIRRCIAQCLRAKDGRGPGQAERALCIRLGQSTVDANTAAAARSVGEWLRAWRPQGGAR